MKNKKNIFSFIVIFTFIIIVGIIYIFNNKKIYTLNLPEVDKIVSISLERNEKNILLSGEEEIQFIYDILKGENRKTTESSANNIPVDGVNMIKLDFNYEDSVAAIIYLYLKNEEYYIEQPLNGIYELTKEEFDSIQAYIY